MRISKPLFLEWFVFVKYYLYGPPYCYTVSTFF
jgi:hypothetical protein